MNDISKMLTEGLAAGFAGTGDITTVERAGFSGKTSHYQNEQGEVYHDEWFVPTHLGGGQELVKVGKEMFTRVYGGGTPAPEKLAALGITADEVGAYLINKIVELGNSTRLFDECHPEPDGDWQYQYIILMSVPDLQVVVAVESITYKGTRVHLHPFILSPVA